MDKNNQSDELLNRIRDELTAILAENATNDPDRRISYEKLMTPTPLPSLEPKSKSATKTKKTKEIFSRPQSYRQAIGGKTITMKPSSGGSSSGEPSYSATTSLRGTPLSQLSFLERTPAMDFMESASARSMDDDVQRMQTELGQSYELFQGIGEKLESINFSGLKSRIRDLHLNNTANDLNKASTTQLQKLFESSYKENRLDKLTADVGNEFRRHPGEFGDIPELSSFFQACTQLEHGLDALKQQRKRSSELEKRLCWATEIAYDRMEEIRNSVGDKPETNF